MHAAGMYGDNSVYPYPPGSQYAAAPGYIPPMGYAPPQGYQPGMANPAAQGYPPSAQYAPGYPPHPQYVTAPTIQYAAPPGSQYAAPPGYPPGTAYAAPPGTQYAAPPGYSTGTAYPTSSTTQYPVPPDYPPGTAYATTPASTNVVVNTASPPSRSQSREWSTGICGCTDNLCNCCMVTWLPCVTYGQISARIGTNGICEDCGCYMDGCIYALWACMGCSWIATFLLRQAVAHKVGVNTDACEDCCCSCVCGPCVLCQMANHLELQKEGCSFDVPPKLESMQR